MEDLQKLEGDDGFCKVLRSIEQKGMKRRERREMERYWRKKRIWVALSLSPVFRYLSAFHDADQEKLRIAGKAFIPAPNEHLRGLAKVNAGMIGFLHRQSSHTRTHLNHRKKSSICHRRVKRRAMISAGRSMRFIASSKLIGGNPYHQPLNPAFRPSLDHASFLR